MSKKQKRIRKDSFKNSYEFTDSLIDNELSYFDYIDRFEKLALSIFEWVNLPSSMDSEFLEKCLYFDGQASLLKTEKYGFINTRATLSGELNIYNKPAEIQCYSVNFEERRPVFYGLKTNTDFLTEDMKKLISKECILVGNNWNRTPTFTSMELFAKRLANADRVCDVNLNAQKTPIMIITNDKQVFTMKQIYQQYNGNQPFIFGDKSLGENNSIKSLKTDAPYLIDKIMNYKKEIWNEALTFLGINNIEVDKKERLIKDEASSNNELINLNLQSFLSPRQRACDLFNEKFGLEGDNKISVRVRSDLHNIIKNLQSTVSDFNNNLKEEGGQNE